MCYINIFTRIVAVISLDKFYFRIFGNKKNAPSFRFRKLCTRWGITIDDKIFKKFCIAGKYQYGYKKSLRMIEEGYTVNNTQLSNLIKKDLASYKYPVLKNQR